LPEPALAPDRTAEGIAAIGIRVVIQTGEKAFAAVDGVDLTVRRGETMALVGESGCGKSLTALALIGLLPPSARCEVSSLRIGGVEAGDGSPRAWRSIRGRLAGFVPQDANGALNPVFTIGYQLTAALRLHHPTCRSDANRSAVNLLDRMKLHNPARVMGAYPHQLSGGMRQRVALALALSGRPAVLIADEPTTALDVTVKRDILELLSNIQREQQLATLFITHDIGAMHNFASHLAVMYAGRIVEIGPAATLLANPEHPYTRALLSARPYIGQGRARLAEIPGQVPAAGEALSGCRFAPRCREVMNICRSDPPPHSIGTDHLTACHLVAGRTDRPS